MGEFLPYIFYWYGIDGDACGQSFKTKKEAMQAHRKAIKSNKTSESRVRLYITEHDSNGKIIAKWTRGEKT